MTHTLLHTSEETTNYLDQYSKVKITMTFTLELIMHYVLFILIMNLYTVVLSSSYGGMKK